MASRVICEDALHVLSHHSFVTVYSTIFHALQLCKKLCNDQAAKARTVHCTRISDSTTTGEQDN